MGGALGLGGGEKKVEASGEVMSRLAVPPSPGQAAPPFVCAVATTMAATPTPLCPHLFLLVAYGTASSAALFPFFFFLLCCSPSSLHPPANYPYLRPPFSNHHNTHLANPPSYLLHHLFPTAVSPGARDLKDRARHCHRPRPRAPPVNPLVLPPTLFTLLSLSPLWRDARPPFTTGHAMVGVRQAAQVGMLVGLAPLPRRSFRRRSSEHREEADGLPMPTLHVS
jgi:hypothetical protein